MDKRQWHPVQMKPGPEVDPVTYALGVLHPNQSVNAVIAIVRRETDRRWKWTVSAMFVPVPFNVGYCESSMAAMLEAEQTIKEYKPEYKAKPCPFCGGTRINFESQRGFYMLRCQDCSASGGYIFDFEDEPFDKETALKRWNERT